ncbi:MAG TPA: Maf family nucleotide pyrophosphatase [Acidocella sp.]|jgi:septum formation protein|nr:Maf family nucleotide pyrophosphatase [Acidocella sp.]
MTSSANVILASASPRRLALLRQIGIEPAQIFAPDIDETPLPAELPRAYAARMAAAKLRPADGFTIAADTVVAAGRRILPKAETVAQAEKCLKLLSGRRHRVFTGLAIRAPDGRIASRVVASVVGFARLDAAEIAAYLASGEWHGKAGGYAIQGQAAAFVDFLSGSYSAVVGLPLHETSRLLHGLGYQASRSP